MSAHLSLAVARLHGILVARPGSDVVHVYAGPLSRRTGRPPRGARPVDNSRIGPMSVVARAGVVVDLRGRRLCGRCEARLSAVARRASQPPLNRDLEVAFWQQAGVTSVDLVHALAVARTVEETHAIAHVTNLLKGLVNTTTGRRPAEPGTDQGRWDFEIELLRRRRELAAATRTPEEIEAAAAQREAEAFRAEQIRAARRNSNAIDRAIDRRVRGVYMRPHERALADSA